MPGSRTLRANEGERMPQENSTLRNLLDECAVVDSDGHVLEPPDLYQRYMPISLRARAPKPISDDFLCPYLEIEGKLYPRPDLQPEAPYRESHRENLDAATSARFSPQSQLAGMNQ